MHACSTMLVHAKKCFLPLVTRVNWFFWGTFTESPLCARRWGDGDKMDAACCFHLPHELSGEAGPEGNPPLLWTHSVEE